MNLPADPPTGSSGYQRWHLELPAELEDLLAAELWGRGSLGIQVREKAAGRVAFDAYFPDPPPASLGGFDLESWHRRGVERLGVDPFAARDWLAEYRAASKPIEVGRRFRIDPRDVDDGAEVEAAPTPGPDGRHTLRIPARSAFGTGSHESTRLALRWLEELDLAGRSVLDVGCGSGVLAFAAELLGAARVVGFDVDPQAALLAAQNARRNRLAARFFAGRVTALGAAGGVGGAGSDGAFDVGLVNVLPERIAGELPALLRRLRPGARVVSSGNLVERRGELLASFAGLGLEPEGELVEGEWVAFLLRSTAGDAGGKR